MALFHTLHTSTRYFISLCNREIAQSYVNNMSLSLWSIKIFCATQKDKSIGFLGTLPPPKI